MTTTPNTAESLADELSKLQTPYKAVHDTLQEAGALIRSQAQEIERLKTDLIAWKVMYDRASDAAQDLGNERDALRAENQRLRASNLNMTQAIMEAYGILWCINTEPMAPIPMLDPEMAAAKARLILKEMLCHEQIGIAINTARAALGDKA